MRKKISKLKRSVENDMAFAFSNNTELKQKNAGEIEKFNNLNVRSKKGMAGITLIALVISIIVLLILARSKYFCNNRK